jgi:uncharacterized membrane protein
MQKTRSYIGLVIITLAYPATHYFVQFIPNPFIPNANLAINMIFPILAGYFYGPFSGAIAGMLGTALSGFLVPDIYDALAIFPHTIMGFAAGLAGRSRMHFFSALSILIGHVLNVLFFWRFDLLTFEMPFTLFLGLLTETTIDVVAITLLIVFLQKKLYREDDQRW